MIVRPGRVFRDVYDVIDDLIRRNILRGLGGIGGAVIGGLGGVEDLGEGELTREEIREAERRFERQFEDSETLRRARARQEQLEREQAMERRLQVGRENVSRELAEADAILRELQQPAPTRRQRIRRGMRRGVQQLVRGRTPRVIGGIIGGLGILDRLGGQPVTQIVNVPPTDPLTPPAITPDNLITPFGYPIPLAGGSSAGGTRTTQRQCECKDQRKRKRRKCLARAGVIWAGGRKKGKPAGTRCLAFENT